MFKPYYGQCDLCPIGKETLIVINKPHLCQYHNKLRKGKEVLSTFEKCKSSIKKAFRKPTGELEVFKEIWAETETHHCFVCGVNLPIFAPILFSHILSKGAYGKFRLLPENIVLKCQDCHHQYEFGDTSHKRWNTVKELKAKLKFKYYNP